MRARLGVNYVAKVLGGVMIEAAGALSNRFVEV
jgi:hypothetical protein